MTTLYLTEPRSVVRKEGDALLVKIPPAEGSEDAPRSVRVPLHKVDQVVVMAGSMITTDALLALLDHSADVCYCDYFGRFRGRLAPEVSKNIFVRTAQFRAHEDYARRVGLAARFVRGKLHNQKTLLLRSRRNVDDDDGAAALADYAGQIDALIGEVERLPIEPGGPPDPRYPQAQSALGTIQGLEGAGAAAFFGGFAHLLRRDLPFVGRHRRPPTDPVNALLSYGYTLLMNQVLSAAQIAGFDPYLGYLHSEGYGKPALALDLMEEMRTPIVDSVVLTVVNKQILRPEHFEEILGVHQLTSTGRKLFLQQLEQRLNTEIQHPVFGYKATYRRCLELQARLLAKFLLGEIPAYRAFQIR